MQIWQLLWGLNSLLVVILGFFIKTWLAGIRKDLDSKADKDTCDRIHKGVDKLLHTHGTLGSAGEVIK